MIHHIEYSTSAPTTGIVIICSCGHGIEYPTRDVTTTASVQAWIDKHLGLFK